VRVESLRVSFGSGRRRVDAVRGVSFEIAPGEALGLVGESGSGKTTVGRAILRLVPASGGRVLYRGVDLFGLSRREVKAFRREAQIVFQDPGGALDPRMRVGDSVAEPLVVHGVCRTRAERRARAAALVERCGLEATCLDRFPHEFSGGQRQRLVIARALTLGPRLLVCDEPTSALDVSVQARILNLLSDLRRDLGLAMLFISHDLAVVRHVCDRVAIMRAGEIVESGSSERIVRAPETAYARELLASVPEVRA
jgi:ABC-type glutathione transport system ATPase component